MASSESAQWIEYEKLAHQIVTDLLPYADVKWDDRIVGNRSATYRQIDVAARWRANEEDYLLVVSVKDWKSRASIKAIDSFIGELEDVGASRAILVCSGGFSKNARVYARRCGIALMSLQTAKSTEWSSELKVPILWERLMARLTIDGRFFFERNGFIVHRDDIDMPRMSRNRVDEVDYFTQFAEAWDEGSLDLTKETDHVFLAPTDEVCFAFKDTDGKHWWVPVRGFTIRYSVTSETWLDYYLPTDARGYIDHLNDSVLVPTFMKLHDLPTAIGPNAVRIADVDALALKAKRMTLSAELRGELKAIEGSSHFRVEKLGA